MDVDARVEGMRRYTVHGELWVQLFFAHDDDPDTFRDAQFSEDTLPAGLRVGDRIVVYYVLNAVGSIRLRRDADGGGDTPQ